MIKNKKTGGGTLVATIPQKLRKGGNPMKNANLFNEMMTLEVPTVTGTVGKYSLGIVNSQNNGKRLTFSKALALELGLTDSVAVMPHAKARKLVIGKTLPFPNAAIGKLSGDGKKICYKTSLVEMLTKMFNIDFSEHVSRTFGDIELDTFNGVTVAIISFPAQVTAGAVATTETVDDDSLEETA